MFSRIFFLVVTVCVVNASVLTVNVFDDDSNPEVASNPKDCNPQACHQLCRRLKFPGGTCVNGRCKCDNFLNVEDEIAEEEYSALEDMVSQKDDPDAEVATNPRRCKDKACNWLCRALNNTSGACVDGRCKCNKSLVAEDDPEAEVAANPSRCRDKACDSVCRALNNTSGACVDGRCKCTKSLVAEGPEAEDPASIRKCSISACSSICKSENKRGICYKGRCKCISNLSAQDTMTDPAESVSRRSCNRRACDDKCRRSGYYGGICIKGQCKCDHFLNTAVSEDLEDSVTGKRCTPEACNNRCRGFGFREGICTGNRCSCITFVSASNDAMNDMEGSISIDDDFLIDNFFSTEGIVAHSAKSPESESSEDQTERGCNSRACEQLCRRLKFKGGACVYGRCKCDIFFGTEDAVDEYSELDTRRGCRITKCNRTCTRLGYDSATCVNRRCKCYNKTQTQDAVDEYSELDTRRGCRITKCNRTCTRLGYDSATCVNRRCKCYNKTRDAPLNEMTSDENEEYNEILRTNKEELTDASPRACNTSTCNNLCRRRGYAGGRCRFDKCQCFQ